MPTGAPAAGQPAAGEEDLTARARIRDAALRRFAEEGVAATSLRAIAEDAGVSPPLVIHHFASKDGLRAACDAYVAARIREGKTAAMRRGMDPLQTLRDVDAGLPLLRYLARTLATGSAHVVELIDELVDDAVAYTLEGVESGALTPTDHPRERAVVLTIWSLGGLVLHEHVERLLGTDITSGPSAWAKWAIPATDILARGVLTEEFYGQWREAMTAFAAQDEDQDQE